MWCLLHFIILRLNDFPRAKQCLGIFPILLLPTVAIAVPGGIETTPGFKLAQDRAKVGNLSAHVRYIPDLQVPDVETALRVPMDQWQRSEHEVFNAGFTTVGYWLRADIEVEPTIEERDWILVVHYADITHLAVMRHDAAGVRELFDTRNAERARGIRVPSRHWLVPVDVRDGQQFTLLLHVKSFGSLQLPISLLPYNIYLESENHAISALHLALGALAALTVIAFLVGWMVRDMGLIYYSLSTSGIIFTHILLQGVWAQWLGPVPQAWQGHFIFVVITLTELAVIFFTREQMRSPGNYPFYLKLLPMMAVSAVFIPLVAAVFLPLDTQRQLAVGQLILFSLIAVWMGIHNSVRRQRAAIYYTLAMIIFFIGTILLALNKVGVLPVNFYTNNLQLVGSVLSAIIFLMAVNERVKLQRRAKMRMNRRALEYEKMVRETHAQLLAMERQTTESLERQVRARTMELEATLVALQQAKCEAETANRQKTRFLAAASHDIRQPLHALALLAEELPAELPARNQKHAQSSLPIRQSVDNLIQLFEALFDLSKLDNQLVQPQLQSLDLAAFLGRFLDTVRPLCNHASVQIRLAIPQRDLLLIRADSMLLQRMLSILVDNALKHAQSSCICLKVTSDGKYISLLVIDDGIGIPQQEQRNIFEEFYQLHNPERDRRKGMGLGLALCRRLAQIQGFDLTLESRLGQGSRFRIRMVICSELPEQPLTVVPLNNFPSLFGLKVLVVDDDPLARQATEQLLQRWGADCRASANSAEALALLVTGWLPRFAILDYRLPDGDNGIRLAGELRTRIDNDLPILIVSGDMDLTVEDATMTLLYKPLKPSRLRAALEGLLRVEEEREPVETVDSSGVMNWS